MATPIVTTVLLIRHAEKVTSVPTDPNPHLSTAGKARAKTLIHVVGKSGTKAIYVSDAIRAKETAQPLAAHLGITPIEMVDALSIKNHILANHAGKTVLMIGHSNTVPDLINRLGAGALPIIGESEFDNLFVVKVLGSGTASVTQLKYGKPSQA